MAKVKVLHITKWFPNKADEQLGIFIEKHIRATQPFTEAHVFHLLPADVDSASIDYSQNNGMPTTTLTYPSESSAIYKMCVFSFEIKKALKSITDKFGEPDLIHGHIYAQPAFIARRYFKQTPLIMSDHWTGFVNGYYDAFPAWKKAAFRKSSQWAFCTTVPSPFLKEAMVKHGFQGQFQIMGNVIESVPKVEKADKSVTRLLSVADLHDHNKNVSGSLRALASIEEKFQFDIIGDGVDAAKLKNLCRDLGLQGQVNFLGRKSNLEVLQHISEADFLLVNSRFETFSMITAEALASGVPVIATRCGGPEQFIDETNGILIDKDSPEQLKSALRLALSRKALFDSQAIRREFQNRFSAEAIGREFNELYQKAINQNGNQ
jgi:glycosyltransferase involved in cell wall biosynthesis